MSPVVHSLRAPAVLVWLCALAACSSKHDAEGTAASDPVAAAAKSAARASARKKPFRPPTDFHKYEDKHLGFLVWAPRKPTTKITPLQTPAGKTLADEYNFGVEGAGSALLITVTQLPSEKGVSPDPEAALTNAREGMRRKLSGTLVADREWKLKLPNGKQLVGREFEIDGKVDRRDVVAYLRMVVRDAWMYQVLALHTHAAASSKRGEAFVRSFRLGDAPKERKLIPGVLPVKVGMPAIEVRRKFSAAKYYLRVHLKAEVVSELMALEHIGFKVWCKLGAVQKSFEHVSQGLRGVKPKHSKDLYLAPFLQKPLDAAPETCELRVSIRKAATDIITLGSFCYAQKKVTKGACPK